MSYGLQQTRRFARAYKKLYDKVAADPTVGERKKGDLAQLLVYKFRSQLQPSRQHRFSLVAAQDSSP